jgi:IMP cyclohydrolase
MNGDPLDELDEQADEIARLRLTDEEREAIAEAVGAYNFNDDDEECARIAATLHGLLKRTERRS